MNILKNTALVLMALLLFSADVMVELKAKSLLDDKVELKVPVSFERMSTEMLRVKYPNERRPTLVFTNKGGSTNVALNHTQNPASQGQIDAYVDNLVQTFRNLYPSAEWRGNGVKEINGRKVGYIELITPAIDTEIYNLIFFTDVDGRLLLCTFNTTIDREAEWAGSAKQIMNSLKVK